MHWIFHFPQHWFNRSDPAVEEASCDSQALRRFVSIDRAREPLPDGTTVCTFRYLLEARDLGDRLLAWIGAYPQENGLQVRSGAVVDTTIIDSTDWKQNKDKARDPEMQQTKKGGQWYFGMKAHIGIDSQSKPIRSIAATETNVRGSQMLEGLRRGDEQNRRFLSEYRPELRAIQDFSL